MNSIGFAFSGFATLELDIFGVNDDDATEGKKKDSVTMERVGTRGRNEKDCVCTNRRGINLKTGEEVEEDEEEEDAVSVTGIVGLTLSTADNIVGGERETNPGEKFIGSSAGTAALGGS